MGECCVSRFHRRFIRKASVPGIFSSLRFGRLTLFSLLWSDFPSPPVDRFSFQERALTLRGQVAFSLPTHTGLGLLFFSSSNRSLGGEVPCRDAQKSVSLSFPPFLFASLLVRTARCFFLSTGRASGYYPSGALVLASLSFFPPEDEWFLCT